MTKAAKKNRHLISITDLTVEEIEKIFSLAVELKLSPADYRNRLAGKMFGLIFEKPSTRTWVSFETGIFQLGGNGLYLGPEDIKLGVREEVRDVARVLNRYLAGIILRTFSHETIIEFAKHFDKPVVNGLSNLEHPCQALSDFFTIDEIYGSLRNLKIAYVGDGNNVCHSLLLAAARLGIHFVAASPNQYQPSSQIFSLAKKEAAHTKAKIQLTTKPDEAVRAADIVYTDVWVSMGQEKDAHSKSKAFSAFQINSKLMAKAKKTAKIMHCLPAHRGQEITNDCLEGKQSIVFDQAENRLHVQKAILIYLFGSNISRKYRPSE